MTTKKKLVPMRKEEVRMIPAARESFVYIFSWPLCPDGTDYTAGWMVGCHTVGPLAEGEQAFGSLLPFPPPPGLNEGELVP